MDEKSIESLEYYEADKVNHAVNVFYNNVRHFDDVASQINTIADKLQDKWQGTAGDMFIEKFETVYGQVVDISDALYSIYDMLQQAQDTFYQADDSLKLSYQESQSSSGGSGGSQSSSDDVTLLPVTPHNVPEQYVPNVCLPPMYPLPVLSSTMGESYDPVFFYDSFSMLPVHSHGVPSALIVSMLYDNKTVRELIEHHVEDMTQCILNYDPKTPVDVNPHRTPDAYRPSLEYENMAPLAVEPHNTPDPHQPSFSYDTMSPLPVEPHNVPDPYIPDLTGGNPFFIAIRENLHLLWKTDPDAHRKFIEGIKKQNHRKFERLIAATVTGAAGSLTRSAVMGKSPEEAQIALGEMMVKMLAPNQEMSAGYRSQLVSVLGSALFSTICGGTTTKPQMETVFDSFDFVSTKQTVTEAINRIVHGMPHAHFMHASLTPSLRSAAADTLQPAFDPLWHSLSSSPVATAEDLLGSTGTQGIDASGLPGGLHDVSGFSMRMGALHSVASAALEQTPADAYTEPAVFTIMPSLNETQLHSANGEFIWTVATPADDALDSAILRLATDPQSLTQEDTMLLRKEAANSITGTDLHFPRL